MTFMYINNFIELMGVLNAYGSGDFNANVKKYPGKQAVGNDVVNALRNNLIGIHSDIEGLAIAAINGDMNVHADPSKYSGNWAKLLNELNTLIETVANKAFWYESISILFRFQFPLLIMI